MHFFPVLQNVVEVFGETKKFHTVKNTPLGRGEIGATSARYYISRAKVNRVQKADMYERLVTTQRKFCKMS